jgi:hypothetical protein
VEFHWVAHDHIYEVEERRHSKKTKRLGHEDNETSKITGHQGPPDIDNDSKNVLDKIYKEGKNEIMNNSNCDGRIDVTGVRLSNKLCPGPNAQKKKRDINLLLQSNLLQETLRGHISGRLPAISLLAGAEDPSKPLEPEDYLASLVALAPTRENRITELGNRVTFDTVIEGGINQPMKEKKEQKKNKTPECSKEGCTTKAHGNTQFLYCLRHNPNPKMCTNCNDNQARRKGGLCNKCFNKTPKDDNALICQGCVGLGNKRKPRKVGGFCTSCIQENNGKKPHCRKCNSPRFRGQLCWRCFHEKEEEGDK